MSWVVAGGLATGFMIPLAIEAAICAVIRVRLWTERFCKLWATTAACSLLGSSGALPSGWPVTTGAALSGLVALALWWWSRRRRKRAPRTLGAESRARLAALVKSMPRVAPRLRPQPIPA